MSKSIITTEKALVEIENFLSYLDIYDPDRSNKTKYWMIDYMKFQEKEINFNSKTSSYKKYNRGDIIKVHFGFKIGREFGGLHYAVVVGMHENRKNDTLVVVPIKSSKKTRLAKGEVLLGRDIINSIFENTKEYIRINNFYINISNDILDITEYINKDIYSLESSRYSFEKLCPLLFNSLNSVENNYNKITYFFSSYKVTLIKKFIDIKTKINKVYEKYYNSIDEMSEINTKFKFYKNEISNISIKNLDFYSNKVNSYKENLYKYCKNLQSELNKIKDTDSIALVNQITTISKLRIYDPVTKSDVLNGVSISKENLKKIDDEIIKYYTE